MGWTQSHLYQFQVGDVEYGEPDDEFGMPIRSAKATPLRKIAHGLRGGVPLRVRLRR